MAAHRRVQLGDRRSPIYIPLSDIQKGYTLEDRENTVVESIFIRADGNGAENIVWFITDGEDYKQKFSLNQLENEDGMAEDMPNIWHTVNYDTVNFIYTALVRFTEPYRMRRLNIVVQHTASFPIRYEVLALRDVGKDLLPPEDQVTSVGDMFTQLQQVQQQASMPEQEVPLAAAPEFQQSGEQNRAASYEVPLALPQYSRDVVLQQNTVPLPEKRVQQSMNVNDIIDKTFVGVETVPPEPGVQDRYSISESSQPVMIPKVRRQVVSQSEFDVPLAGPIRKREVRKRWR